MTGTARSLRQVLTGQFLAVGLLPLLAVAVLAAAVLVPILRTEAEQRQMELAVAIRDQVSIQLLDHQQFASVVAGHLTEASGVDDADRSLLRSVVRVDSIVLAVYLADERGEVKAAAIRPDSGRSEVDAIGLDVSAQPYFIEARQRMAPVWSDVFVSTLTGRVTAMLVVPRVRGTLLMELSLESLSGTLGAISRTRSTATAIIDRAGRLVAHPDVALALQQQRLPVVAALPAASAGTASVVLRPSSWFEDHVVLLPVEPNGWTVVVSQPVTVTLAPVFVLGIGLVLIVIATGTLALVSARRYAARTSGQVERLAAAATEAARQERTTVPLRFEVRELEGLWRNLEALFAKLRDRDLAMQAANRDLKSVLDTARLVAIYATDPDGLVTVFNQGAALMLARPASEVIGRTDALSWHDPREVEAVAREVGLAGAPTRVLLRTLVAGATGGGQQSREWTMVRADGARILVSLAISPMLEAGGAPKGYLFVGVDVSERKRAAELEVAHRVALLASQAKSEFLSKMSHELRTPLNAILGFAELMQARESQPLAPIQREHLRYIQEAGWHLLELISDVLDLGRIESGGLRVETKSVALGDLMPKVARLSQAAMAANAVELRLDPGLACRQMRVEADETRLTQVLVNLLSNGAKYNRRGGVVEVSCGEDAGRVLLRVHDTGRGMSAEQLSHLFEPFNRLGHERSRIEGTGIGLVISKHLVELMGGTLAVTSEIEAGTTFTLSLPATVAPPPPSETPDPAAAMHAAQPQQPHRVLYVEDNEVNVALMQAMLERRPRIVLDVADRASTALEQARAMPPDLILLDMQLPDADGMDVLRSLAADDRLRGIAVIVVTADATTDREAMARAAGACAFLRKPLRLAETLAVIDDVLAAGEVDAS